MYTVGHVLDECFDGLPLEVVIVARCALQLASDGLGSLLVDIPMGPTLTADAAVELFGLEALVGLED